jgi:hypothetical protein
MFGASLGAALGAGTQGFYQGKQDAQSYQAQAEQIKGQKIANQMGESKLNVQKNMEYIQNEATKKYKVAKTNSMISNVYTDISRDTVPNFNAINKGIQELPELQQALGTTKINPFNPNPASGHMQAAMKLLDPNGTAAADDMDNFKAQITELGNKGFLVFTDDGKAFDIPTLAAVTGSLDSMPASVVQDVEKKALGVFSPRTTAPVKDTEHQEFEKSEMFKAAGSPKSGTKYEETFRQWKGTTAQPKSGTGKDDKKASRAYTYMEAIGFKNDDYVFKQEHMDKAAVDLNLMSDEQRKNYKQEVTKANKLSNAYGKSVELMNKLDNPDLDIGWTANFVSTIEKAMTSEMYDKLTSPEQKVAHLLKVTADTQGGAILAEYMNTISGTGVAAAEAQRLMKIFNSGSYANKQSYKAAIKEFAGGMKDTVNKEANRLAYDVPIAALELKKVIQTADGKRQAPAKVAKLPSFELVNQERVKKGQKPITRAQYDAVVSSKRVAQ